MNAALLEIHDLSKRFGGVEAVSQVSFDIPRWTLVGLIGPNGAGKTTFVNLVTKHEKPDSGTIHLDAEPIHHLPAYKVARAGISRTYQKSHFFWEESVRENLMTAMVWSGLARSGAEGLSYPGLKGNEEDRTEALLKLFGLQAQAEAFPGDISPLLRKRAEIAQALAVAPKLLLLDEPFGGLTIEEAFGLIEPLRECLAGGLTILLIDHNMKVVMEICEQIFVMHHGNLIATGTPAQVCADERVCKVYLSGEM